MEGYGAAMGADAVKTPIIVIRGISDMRKDKTPEDDAIYQPVAAMNAAAFGVRLLDEWSDRHQPQPVALQPMAQAQATTEDPAPAPAGRTVFNLDAEIENLSEEQLERIVETIRQRTGKPSAYWQHRRPIEYGETSYRGGRPLLECGSTAALREICDRSWAGLFG